MNRIRLSLVKAGHIKPAGQITVGTTRIDPQALVARQQDAGRVRRAMAILERAAARPCANDNMGRRVVDARCVRAVAYVG